jgi:anti-anti-sigma regulatory factor
VARPAKIQLVGVLASGTAQELGGLVKRLLERGDRAFVLDLNAMTSCDPEGLGELVRCYTLTTRSGGELALTNAPDHFRRFVESGRFL